MESRVGRIPNEQPSIFLPEGLQIIVNVAPSESGVAEEIPLRWPAPPRAVFSTSLVDLGDDHVRLAHPLVVVVEDHGEEIVASWPEVEAWGSGATEAEAL